MQDIWSAYAGPGVHARGLDHSTWADQVDTRPTLLALTGLRDDYSSDGRVLIEDLSSHALPISLQANRAGLIQLGRVYKQILAADGSFAMDTLTASSKALRSGSAANDATYRRTEAALAGLDTLRDRLADQMSGVLLGAAYDHRASTRAETERLSIEGAALLAAAHALART